MEVMLSVFQLLIRYVYPSIEKCHPCPLFVLFLIAFVADIGDYVV